MLFVPFNHAICTLLHAICTLLSSEIIATQGIDGGLKAFKSFLKTKKGNQRQKQGQNQRLWHSLRSCLFEKQRQKQKRL